MRTVSAFFILLFCSLVLSQEQRNPERASSSDDACIDKPCGPFVCQARCVASCLDTGLATSVEDCRQNFCREFSDNTPCPLNDTACWKTCGFTSSSDDPPSPPFPDDLRVAPWADGFSSANSNPKTVRLEWPSTKDTILYIVEAFPMFGKDPASNSQHVIKKMTTDTSFSLERADLCNVYMVRIMAVNGFGTSPPRYLIVDAWKPELHFDENFDVHHIRREGDYVQVLINFAPPQSWRPGDVELEKSFVRAHDCLAPLDEDLFLNKQPDQDGYYTPMVFINESASAIELSFPAKIMYSKCLYSYRVSALHTLCNASVQLDTKDRKSDAGVDFALNCLSVENSDCPPDSTESKSESQNKTNSSESAEVTPPEVTIELTQSENSTLVNTTTNTDVLAKSDSKEVVVVVNPDAIKELENETTTAGTTPANKHESGEVAVAAIPAALKELEEEQSAGTTPSVGTTKQSSGGNPTEPLSTPPSPFATDEEPPHVILVVEPRDPSVPLCKLIEFDAQAEIEADEGIAKEEKPATLTISWLEDKPADITANPSHFLVRYGPVIRTLVVDQQPVITDETIVRTADASESPLEVPRVLKVTNLIPNSLYAFQICAIFDPKADLAAAWDMAPRYMVDLSAASAIWRNGEIKIEPAMSIGSSIEGNVSISDLEFVDSFIDALNASFNAAQAAMAALTDTEAPDDGSQSQTTAAPFKEHSEENSEEATADILQLNIPQQPPPVLNIDVKPVLITDTNAWAPMRIFWLILALILLGVTAFAFMFFVMKRSRMHRGQKGNHFKATTAIPVYTTQTASPIAAAPDVKIPVP